MTTKYVDIIKKDKSGNTLVTQSLTDKDLENINKMGVAIKNTIKDVSDLTTKESKDVENLEEKINNNKKLNDNVLDKHELEISKNSAEIENIKSITDSNKKDISTLKTNVDTLEQKVQTNISALSNRVEEIYNNGIDEVQQKRIEALEKVDVDTLDKIQDASNILEELESKGLKNYDADINSLT